MRRYENAGLRRKFRPFADTAPLTYNRGNPLMKLSQKVRVIILLIYAAALFCVCRYLFGAWLPPSTEKGLWLYASLANILLGNLLLSPYFTKPAGAVSDAVVAGLALPGVHGAVVELHRDWAIWGWRALLFYYLLIVLVGMSAILVREPRSQIAKGKFGQTLYELSVRLGETSFIFSVL